MIAAVHGNALGGGLQLALAADVRIAAPDTRMSVMEIRYGLIPDMGLSRTLPGLVRDDVARELTYTGRVVEADEALELGLVTRIARTRWPRRRSWRAEIASKSPQAIRSAKRLLGEAPALGHARRPGPGGGAAARADRLPRAARGGRGGARRPRAR